METLVCISHSVLSTLCDPMGCSLPGSSVHGILQARILEWVAISSSRGSSWSRDQIQVSCIAGKLFTIWATGEVYNAVYNTLPFITLDSDPCSCLRFECSGKLIGDWLIIHLADRSVDMHLFIYLYMFDNSNCILLIVQGDQLIYITERLPRSI